MIHFVKYQEETMMLIVSPLAFRTFATSYGEEGDGVPAETAEPADRLGMGIQRAFNRVGWHMQAPNGRNVFSFQAVRNGGQGGNLLNGFLIADPSRYVNPVPPPNERLILWSNLSNKGGKL